VEYDGTEFVGWQFQPTLRSVCGTLESALAELFNGTVKLTCAGRTDSGVHASGQVVSWRSAYPFPIERLALAANAKLPPDLSVREAALAPAGFNARYDARRRIYEYLIVNRPMRSAYLHRIAHHVYRPIDPELFREAARELLGEHDFVGFCGVLPDRGGTIRTIRSVDFETNGDLARVRIVGDGFLHRMVRNSVGTLIEIAQGLRPQGDIARILASKDRREAGYAAPACGLSLAGVVYDDFTSYRERTLAGFLA
jgi:tRNA pseudouridine38-40 synthase